MNKQILSWVAVATLSLNLQVGRAADMSLNLFQEYALFDNVSSGNLWLGNFGTNGGSLLSSSQVNSLLANDKEALFSLFRPVASSFSFTNGRIDGLTSDGLISLVSVGTALGYTDEQGSQLVSPDTATQFAGQNLYLLANNRVGATANSWFNETLILFKAAANFGSGDASDGPLNSPEVEISINGGSFLLGSQTGTASDNLASGAIVGVAVPEPSSISMLVIGATALAALRLRRKQA
jgi:PEP-CTERM motif